MWQWILEITNESILDIAVINGRYDLFLILLFYWFNYITWLRFQILLQVDSWLIWYYLIIQLMAENVVNFLFPNWI